MKKLILASTSTLHGQSYLEYLLPVLKDHFTDEILFVPYARPGGVTYDEYTAIVKKHFKKISISVKGIHEFENPIEAVQKAKGIFIGGGNTFELVNQLYKNDLLESIRTFVNSGTPYLGTSAGSNVAGISMQTTNDMPVVYPPSFETLALIPYNLNPHFVPADPNSKHMGETRETRIKEFHIYNDIPVIGLKEGSWLEVNGGTIVLKGELETVLFEKGKDQQLIPSGTELKI